jgi:O-antigen/teichoic acid export membrane protein
LIYFLPTYELADVASLYLFVSIIVVLIGSHQLVALYIGKYQLAGHRTIKNSEPALGNEVDPTLKQVLYKTTPFGLESSLFLIHYQSDLILLRYLVNEKAAGFYAVAAVVMAAAYLVPSVLYQKFFLPTIHRWSFNERARLRSFLKIGTPTMFLIGFFLMLITWFSSPYFIPLIFGENYFPAVSLVGILALSMPFRYLAIHLGSILSTRDFIWLNLKITAFTALLNILLNLALIPKYGAEGAAVATVTCHITLALCFVIAVWSGVEIAEKNNDYRKNRY